MKKKRLTLVIALAFILLSIDSSLYAQDEEWDIKKSKHFIVYHREVPTEYVSEVIREAEKYYKSIIDYLGFGRSKFWTWENRCKIYLYPSREQYMEMTNAKSWSAGKVHVIRKEIATLLGGSAHPQPNEGGSSQPASKTPALDSFGRDLTKLTKEGKLDPVIGRKVEIERVIQILSRRTKNNPVLLGEAGVGKTAIVEGLAQDIVKGDVPEILRGKRIVVLDLALMIAGTKYRGQFEERIKAVMEEIKRSKDVIIFIDEMHTLVGAGAAEGAIDSF